jgi:VanZ family protein
MDRRTIAAWAVTVLLLVLCFMPSAWVPRGEESPRRIPNLDKVIHFGMFAAFGAAWVIAAKDASGRRARAAWVFAAAVALAVGTELAQGHPAIDRDPDLFDTLADCLGGVAGILVALPKRGTETSTGPIV